MIINLTQHQATSEQSGVVEPSNKKMVQELLTFNVIPSRADIIGRAEGLASIAMQSGAKKAMIGGAPYLMSELENALKNVGIVPLYAFSERVSVEKEVDGSIVKTNVFRHVGFVEV